MAADLNYKQSIRFVILTKAAPKMKAFYCIIILVLFVTETHWQKPNPIVYSDFTIGGSFGKAPSLFLGSGLNYQHKNDLFTLRFSGTIEIGVQAAYIAPIILIPVFVEKSR